MRNEKRIDIFLGLLDWDRFYKQFEIPPLTDNQFANFVETWREHFDMRCGQLLINLGYAPDSQLLWTIEEEDIIKSQNIPIREYFLWGQSFDSDGNRLMKINYILLKDMDSDHIQAVIKLLEMKAGLVIPGYSKSLKLFKDELEFRNKGKQ